MKAWFSKLNLYYKTAVVSAIVTFVILAGTSCLFFLNLMEIPLGILLGSSIGIIFYAVIGKISNKEKEGKPTVTIIAQIIRFLLIAVALVLSGWLYYKENLHIFNIFAVLGGYAIPLISLIIVSRKESNIDGNIL